MKIRLGFVSNSSSSSFITVNDKDHHDKLVAKVSNKLLKKALAKCKANTVTFSDGTTQELVTCYVDHEESFFLSSLVGQANNTLISSYDCMTSCNQSEYEIGIELLDSFSDDYYSYSQIKYYERS